MTTIEEKRKNKARKMYNNLNQRQQAAFCHALKGENLFITGSGGVGKTYLLESLVYTLENILDKRVLQCAPTGTAARNMSSNACTIHRQFGFNADVCLKHGKKGTKPIAHADRTLCNTDVLIIDEISMVRIDIFESIMASLRKANAKREEYNKKPIQVILCGDFYQLSPVITDEDREILEEHYGPVGAGYAFQSEDWEALDLLKIELNEVVRQKDVEFVEKLNQARKGSIDCDYFNDNTSRFPIPGAINILPYNKQVDAYNLKKLEVLDGKAVEFPAMGIGFDEDKVKNLTVKVGARVMITMNYTKKICYNLPPAYEKLKTPLFTNGSMGTVVAINIDEFDHKNDTISVLVDDGGYVVNILRFEYKQTKMITGRNGKRKKETMSSYFQFPLVLGYATTTHKSQGKTFSAVTLDPRSFGAGQLYVALSRCKTIKGVFLVELIRKDFLITDKEVKNFMND